MCILYFFLDSFLDEQTKSYIPGADPGFGVRGEEIRHGDLRVLLLLCHMFMERMMQENLDRLAGYYDKF